MPLLGSDLHYALKEIQEASGVDLSKYRIIDVPIIDNVGERTQFAAIMRAFGVDPSQFPTSFWPWWQQEGYIPNALHGTTLRAENVIQAGSVLWRPFEGLPEEEDPTLFLGAPEWDYAGFIVTVRRMLETSQNVALYVHCQLGADRTGAFHIGYLMHTMGLSLAEASSMANGSTSAGPPNGDYQRLVAAYADTLRG